MSSGAVQEVGFRFSLSSLGVTVILTVMDGFDDDDEDEDHSLGMPMRRIRSTTTSFIVSRNSWCGVFLEDLLL